MAGRKAVSSEVRFAEKCKPNSQTGCIEWTGGTTKRGPQGYGLFHTRQGMRLAHRWAFEQERGATPPHLDVCHRCDNRLCVFVEHLFVGTRKENMEDAVRKGRTSHVARSVGEKHPMHVLSERDVISIRVEHRAGSPMRLLSDSFGVSFAQISRIVRHESWKHIKEMQ